MNPYISVRHTMHRKMLWCTMSIAVLVTSVWGCRQHKPKLVDIGVVPEFAFLDQNNKPIGSADLRGRPWVASFAFTSCASACPPLMRAHAKLQKRVNSWNDPDASKVSLVTITVDPATDTPERLKKYSEVYDVDDRVWRFARGEYKEMEELVTKGFMMPLIRNDAVDGKDVTSEPTPIDTAHSVRFVLVDGDMHIRGLFEKDEHSLRRLDAALQYLVNQREVRE